MPRSWFLSLLDIFAVQKTLSIPSNHDTARQLKVNRKKDNHWHTYLQFVVSWMNIVERLCLFIVFWMQESCCALQIWIHLKHQPTLSNFFFQRHDISRSLRHCLNGEFKLLLLIMPQMNSSYAAVCKDVWWHRLWYTHSFLVRL